MINQFVKNDFIPVMLSQVTDADVVDLSKQPRLLKSCIMAGELLSVGPQITPIGQPTVETQAEQKELKPKKIKEIKESELQTDQVIRLGQLVEEKVLFTRVKLPTTNNSLLQTSLFGKRSQSMAPQKNVIQGEMELAVSSHLATGSKQQSIEQTNSNSKSKWYGNKDDIVIEPPDVLTMVYDESQIKRAKSVFKSKMSKYSAMRQYSDVLSRQPGPMVANYKYGQEKPSGPSMKIIRQFKDAESVFLEGSIQKLLSPKNSNPYRFNSPQNRVIPASFLSQCDSVQRIAHPLISQTSETSLQQKLHMQTYITNLQNRMQESQHDLTLDILRVSDRQKRNMVNQVKSKYLDHFSPQSYDQESERGQSQHDSHTKSRNKTFEGSYKTSAKESYKTSARESYKSSPQRSKKGESRPDSQFGKIKLPSIVKKRVSSNSVIENMKEFIVANQSDRASIMKKIQGNLDAPLFQARGDTFRNNHKAQYNKKLGPSEQEEMELQLISKMVKQKNMSVLAGIQNIRENNFREDFSIEEQVTGYLTSISQAPVDVLQSYAERLVNQAKIDKPHVVFRNLVDGNQSSMKLLKSGEIITPENQKEEESFGDQMRKSEIPYGIQFLSENLVNKFEFGALMKHQNEPKMAKVGDDPHFQLAKFLSKQTQLPKQILKALDKKLTELRLWKIILRAGQVKAIADTFQFMPQLQVLLMDENNLSDENLSTILKSANEQVPMLKSLTYRGASNYLGDQGIREVCDLVRRRAPYQLETLEIRAIKLQQAAKNVLFQVLSESSLQTFSMCDIKVHVNQYKLLCSQLPLMLSLRNLKLSNLGTSALSNQELLAALIKCQLDECNIGGMILVDANPLQHTDVNALSLNDVYHVDNTYFLNKTGTQDDDGVTQEQVDEAVEVKKVVRNEYGEEEGTQNKVVWRSVPCMKSTPDFVLEKILKVMEQQSLIHLDLSNSGMTKEMVLKITKALKTNKFVNLRCVHLNNDRQHNLEALDQDLIEQMAAILGLDVDRTVQSLLEGDPHGGPIDQNLVQMNKELKKQLDQRQNAFEKRQDLVCVQRFLLRDVMQSNDWTLSKAADCWVCNKSTYTLVDFQISEPAPKQCCVRFQTKVPGLISKELDLKIMLNHLRDVDRHQIVQENLDQKFADFMENQKSETQKQIVKNISVTHLMTNLGSKSKWLALWYKKRYPKKEWLHILRKNNEFHDFQYKQFELSDQDNQDTHRVFALMLKPGIHHLELVVDDKVTQHQLFVGMRESQVQYFQSEAYRSQLLQPFKSNSVMSEFKEDDVVQIKLMLDHDQKQWKVHNFIRIDSDLSVVKRVFQKQAKKLKEIFMALASQSAEYPYVHWNQLTDFCQSIGLIDGLFSLEDLGHCFMHTVFEPERHIQDHELPRDVFYEREKYLYKAKKYIQNLKTTPTAVLNRNLFFEILVRIAIKKYTENFKPPKSIFEAFSLVIEDELLGSVQITSSCEFRRAVVCTNEMEMWFKQNSDQLHALYFSFGDEKGPTLQTITQMLNEQGMSEVQARQMFVQSKQTNVNENVDKYFRLQYVEFLDFLCRLTQFKFLGVQGYQFSMQFKLCLDSLLSKLGLRSFDPSLFVLLDAQNNQN